MQSAGITYKASAERVRISANPHFNTDISIYIYPYTPHLQEGVYLLISIFIGLYLLILD